MEELLADYKGVNTVNEWASENASLKSKNQMLQELLTKVGNGEYNNIEEVKKGISEGIVALDFGNDIGPTSRLPAKEKGGGESEEVKVGDGVDKNKGTIADERAKNKEVDGVANIMGLVAAGGGGKKVPEPKKELVGIDNILGSIGAAAAAKRGD